MMNFIEEVFSLYNLNFLSNFVKKVGAISYIILMDDDKLTINKISLNFFLISF